MIKSTNEVDICEIDGEAHRGFPHPKISVVSHWNWETMVVIKLPDGGDGKEHTITVHAKDLQTAVTNARNSNRHG